MSPVVVILVLVLLAAAGAAVFLMLSKDKCKGYTGAAWDKAAKQCLCKDAAMELVNKACVAKCGAGTARSGANCVRADADGKAISADAWYIAEQQAFGGKGGVQGDFATAALARAKAASEYAAATTDAGRLAASAYNWNVPSTTLYRDGDAPDLGMRPEPNTRAIARGSVLLRPDFPAAAAALFKRI